MKGRGRPAVARRSRTGKSSLPKGQWLCCTVVGGKGACPSSQDMPHQSGCVVQSESGCAPTCQRAVQWRAVQWRAVQWLRVSRVQIFGVLIPNPNPAHDPEPSTPAWRGSSGISFSSSSRVQLKYGTFRFGILRAFERSLSHLSTFRVRQMN